MDEDLTSLFIQFAEEYFTGNPTDPLHHPTVKSCLLRVPWTLNAKSTTDIGRTVTTRVKVIQRWDGKRPSIQPLLKHFRTWLMQKRVDDTQETSKQKYIKFNSIIASQNQQNINNKISWIEQGILESTLSDHRKYVIWRILSPYLLNVRKLPKEESYSIIKDWLDKCNKLQGLNFNPKEKIRQNLKGASKGHYPISLEKLKEENKPLYYTIASRFSHNYD